MATKKLSELGSKSTLDSTDSFVLSTSSGGRRINKANAENWARNSIGTQKITNISMSPGNWIRVAKINYEFMGLISVTNYYNEMRPNGMLCYITGYPSSSINIFIKTLYPGDYKKIRFTKDVDSTIECYLEILMPVSSNAIVVGKACDRGITLLDATISNNNNVMAEFDLTTSTSTLQANTPLNSIDMQVTENQTSKMGGGIIKIPISPDVSLLVKKGGRHNGNKNTERQNQVADTDHFSFRSFDDLCRFIGESEESKSKTNGSNKPWKRCGFEQHTSSDILSQCKGFFLGREDKKRSYHNFGQWMGFGIQMDRDREIANIFCMVNPIRNTYPVVFPLKCSERSLEGDVSSFISRKEVVC